MTTSPDAAPALIDRWFPVAAVDEACGTPAGSGQNEKAIFTWFASRPIAQARAAVLCSLLRDAEGGDAEMTNTIEHAIREGDEASLADLATQVPTSDGLPPVVLDCFSGRGIIPLEAARIGMRAVGTDLSPVAVLASRLLADWSLRDWSAEPNISFPSVATEQSTSGALFDGASSSLKLLGDLRTFFEEVGRRTAASVDTHYPRNDDGTYPWGYLWAITVPCDSCTHRFPLLGSLVLRQPYRATNDPGQSLRLVVDAAMASWSVEVHDGPPESTPTHAAAPGKRGKSARCPFCQHAHSLDTVKAKGFAGQYQDVPLAAAEVRNVTVVSPAGKPRKVERKVFRTLRPDEVTAATEIVLAAAKPFGELPATPDEPIAPGNNHAIRASAYGYARFGDLMNARQTLQFIETAHAIRACRADLVATGTSAEYSAVLAGFAAANLVRRLRSATRGSRLRAVGKPDGSEQNRNKMGDLFANEGSLSFAFDWFETGPGTGPGTWASLTETTLTPLKGHLANLPSMARAGRFRRSSATSLPYRDGTIDACVCDPPYYQMVDYADISDLFYVWLRRCLFDIVPDLFGVPSADDGLQDKSDEIIVKDSAKATGDHRTTEWYERRLSDSFREMRRVLKPGGTLSVVFGHSDPDAWRRLLGALRDAGFVVTAAWPARTESGNTGVASIKVTITIGCLVAPEGRRTATAAQVEREIAELVYKRVKKWDAWNLALSDQLMACYGPAMQVVGRYRTIQRPDGSEPDLDHFLAIGRRAVADAHAFKVDELPLDTFDPATRFAIFWLRTFGRAQVNKGEAVFHAQSSQMKIEDLRPHILTEAKGGYAVTLGDPPTIDELSPVIHVARALAAAWPQGGTDGAAEVLAASGRPVDDPHLWATVAELVRQLPESDKVAMALTACQRNRRPIEAAAAKAAPTDAPEQLVLDPQGDAR